MSGFYKISLTVLLIIEEIFTNFRRGHTHTYTYSQDGGVKPLIIPFLVTKVDKKNKHPLPDMNRTYPPSAVFLNSLHIFCVSSCSWHEMGTKDLPTVIDYILQTTGAEQIFYAGHSMGTTMFYVLCAERPEYNSKIRAMFSLAPIAFMSNMKSPLIQLTATIGDELGVSCQLT